MTLFMENRCESSKSNSVETLVGTVHPSLNTLCLSKPHFSCRLCVSHSKILAIFLFCCIQLHSGYKVSPAVIISSTTQIMSYDFFCVWTHNNTIHTNLHTVQKASPLKIFGGTDSGSLPTLVGCKIQIIKNDILKKSWIVYRWQWLVRWCWN